MIQVMDRDCSTRLRTAHAIESPDDALEATSHAIDDAMDAMSIADHDSAISFETVSAVDQVKLISEAETGCRTLHDGAVWVSTGLTICQDTERSADATSSRISQTGVMLCWIALPMSHCCVRACPAALAICQVSDAVFAADALTCHVDDADAPTCLRICHSRLDCRDTDFLILQVKSFAVAAADLTAQVTNLLIDVGCLTAQDCPAKLDTGCLIFQV